MEHTSVTSTLRINFQKTLFYFIGYRKHPIKIQIAIPIQTAAVACITVIYMQKRNLAVCPNMIMDIIC